MKNLQELIKNENLEFEKQKDNNDDLHRSYISENKNYQIFISVFRFSYEQAWTIDCSSFDKKLKKRLFSQEITKEEFTELTGYGFRNSDLIPYNN